jgi:hypothetical protein
MYEAIPPFPQYVYMAWCLIKIWIRFYIPLNTVNIVRKSRKEVKSYQLYEYKLLISVR